MFSSRFYTPHFLPQQRHYHQQKPNFEGLFRLIDDWDRYAQETTGLSQYRQTPSFTPKFDVKETDTGYELHGELPGIKKENVHIEFTDPQTIQIRGRVDRSYTAGTPPAGLLDNNSTEMAGALPTAAAHEHDDDDPVVVDSEDHHETSSNKSFKATVEDEADEGTTTTTTNTTAAAPTPATTVAETVKKEQQPKKQKPKHKFWVSERSVGEFTRTFAFPSRVESEAVTAGLDNGILTISVPKAKKHESRRIAVL